MTFNWQNEMIANVLKVLKNSAVVLISDPYLCNISQDIFGILQPFYNIPVSKFYDRTLPVKDNFNGPDLS